MQSTINKQQTARSCVFKCSTMTIGIRFKNLELVLEVSSIHSSLLFVDVSLLVGSVILSNLILRTSWGFSCSYCSYM